MTADLDDLEAIADGSRGDLTFDTPKGRSRKFRLATARSFSAMQKMGGRKRSLLNRLLAAAPKRRGK